MNRFNQIDEKMKKFENVLKDLRESKSLKETLTEEKVFLPETGYAYIVAGSMREKINPNQLRKFYDMIVDAREASKKDFKTGFKKLCFLVPQIAYSVGRNLCDRNMYELFKASISETKIKSYEDIKAFSDFFESIVAYKKFMENNKGGK